jgi:hypothetical protein
MKLRSIISSSFVIVFSVGMLLASSEEECQRLFAERDRVWEQDSSQNAFSWFSDNYEVLRKCIQYDPSVIRMRKMMQRNGQPFVDYGVAFFDASTLEGAIEQGNYPLLVKVLECTDVGNESYVHAKQVYNKLHEAIVSLEKHCKSLLDRPVLEDAKNKYYKDKAAELLVENRETIEFLQGKLLDHKKVLNKLKAVCGIR